MSKLLKTTRTTHGILRHARFINSSQKRSLFGFSRRSGYYEDARNEEGIYSLCNIHQTKNSTKNHRYLPLVL
jgi:hypothetical protein